MFLSQQQVLLGQFAALENYDDDDDNDGGYPNETSNYTSTLEIKERYLASLSYDSCPKDEGEWLDCFWNRGLVVL